MLFLIRNVMAHGIESCRAHGESGIAVLPRETSEVETFFEMCGRGLFQFPHNIRETMGGLESDKKMNMVGRAANALRLGIQSAQSSTEIFVDAR